MHSTSKRSYLPLTFALFLFAVASFAKAEDLRIIAPYVGSLTDVYKDDSQGLDLKDSGLITGLYFQWINTERYQWNAFLYYAPDVNYTKVLGGHFIFDYYLGPDWYGKFVLGAGLEAMHNKMDAGSNIEGLSVFDMDYTVWTPYLRAGKYFKAEVGPAELSFLPWAGIEPVWIRGDLSGTAPPYPPYMPTSTDFSESMDAYQLYSIAGANLRVMLFHFVDIEGKYQVTYGSWHAYSTVNAIASVFFTRDMAFSYRYKYMQSLEGTGSDSYHFFGLAYLF
jgi:hypothetical protein